jgi:outer membrane receptor protein involved in Fe transport
MRIMVVAAAVSLSVVGLSAAQGAAASIKKPVNIHAQGLETALQLFSKESGLHVVYVSEDVNPRTTKGASGALTQDEALTQILGGTGLTYRYLDDDTVTIMPTPSGGAPTPPTHEKTQGGTTSDQHEQGGQKKPLWDGFRLAQADRADNSGNAPLSTAGGGQSERNQPVALDEVVVTATKLGQPARTVAGSVEVTTGTQLDALGSQSFEDYLTRVPGVVFNAGIPGLSTAVIRGVSTTTSLDQGQGTTGYFVNEVPLTDPNFAVAIPDIDTFDVDNVAVMRGPQGTLFGSASLGGAINYQTALPDLTRFQARLQGTFADTAHGANSKSGKGMVNVPLVTDKLAVRAVFVYRNDGGFINNIGTGFKDSNSTLIRGGRAEVLWTPVEGTKVSYLFLKQLEDTADIGYSEPALAGSFEKKTLIPEYFDVKTTINNVRLDQDVGFGTLTATATYHQKAQVSVSDLTAEFGPLFGNQLAPIYGPQQATSNGTTFEIRLASPTNQRFTYLVGAMRDLTREFFLDTFGAPGAEQYATTTYDPIFGTGFGARAAPDNIFYTATLGAKGEERALFGEGTFHFNDSWAATLGGRFFDTQVTGTTSASGLLEYLLTSPSVLDFSYSSPERSRGFTPKASVTWTATPDIMVYALASKGFRFGGPNVNPPEAATPFPPNYAPDSLWNYEIGTRTNWFDRRLQLDVTAFYIDWSNIQVRLATASGLAYATNLGKASNYGLESTALWRPFSALTFQGSLTYLDATLKQAFTSGATVEPAGTPLPGTSRWNFSASASYQLTGLPLQPSIVLADRYISSALAGYGFVVPETQGDYNLLDCRLNAYFKDIQATLFVNNIADKRGVSNASYYTGGGPFEQYVVRPRTVGLTLDYRY